jgi:hypothetical protein
LPAFRRITPIVTAIAQPVVMYAKKFQCIIA